ncbi:alpha-beta hydrolase superfamily lysophospholipase [Stella humosa]|uniref:Alpha-beta hydrolase superfamily lysophospholipase n=1 Tax=Stella humosa TaxID=94 RepID=A0A3N1LQ01_9PROT|nr:alpha/beta fold hydrolase [Stella humosa]ROP91275.1 alpha-beta hydrolase superfamily lysophospholipase [Stella humosa]BBK34371.1 alpha/beta hydrolase [Stella humosa]
MDLLVDGRRVFAATGGKPFDPARAPVLLLHGAGMDHTAWGLQTRWLAHHGRSVLAVDLPGHGRSAGPGLASIPDMGRWVLALLDAAGADRVAIGGHSMGALVALAGVAAAPDRFRALALLGVTPDMPVHPDLVAAARAGGPLAPELMSSWGFGPRAQLGGHRAPGLWMVAGGIRLIGEADPETLATDLEACAAYGGALAAAAAVACPTLLLLGAEDRMTPAGRARPLGQAIAGARTVVLAGAGHMIMTERPDETLSALAEIF